MIEGFHDRYLTVEELAEMIGRSPKTIQNWAASGKLRFVNLCGVPLISIRMLENLILGRTAQGDGGELARKLALRDRK